MDEDRLSTLIVVFIVAIVLYSPMTNILATEPPSVNEITVDLDKDEVRGFRDDVSIGADVSFILKRDAPLRTVEIGPHQQVYFYGLLVLPDYVLFVDFASYYLHYVIIFCLLGGVTVLSFKYYQLQKYKHE